MMLTRTLFILLVITFGAKSQDNIDDSVLSIDRVIPNNFNLVFPNETNIQPELSDFEVNNYVLMSNDSGERWAVITLTNISSGRRTLSHKHLMAVVADGQRIAPMEITQSFKAKETISLTINFGESKFPLLSIYSRANI